MRNRSAICALPLLLTLLPCAALGGVRTPVPTAKQAQAKARAKAVAAQTQFQKGVAAMSARQFDEALKCFQSVIASFPNAAPAYVNTGLVYRLKNDPERAEVNLRKGVALAPRDFMAVRALADLYGSQKRWAEAAPLLRRAASLRPGDALTHAAAGEAEMYLGHPAAAEPQFRAAARLRPDLLPVHRRLASIYSAQNRSADLRRELLAIQKATPKDPKLAFSLGVLFARANMPKPALAQFQRAVALDPSNTQAAADVAQLQMQLGQTKQATATFQKVLKQRPNDPQAHFALGVAAYSQKKYAEAERHFRAVLAAPAKRPHVGARINLAGALLNQNKTKEAAAQYEIALKEDPKNKLAYNMLAFAYQRQGLNDKATATYKRLLDVDPNNTDALAAVALAAQFAGQPAEAIPYYERLLKSKPGDEMAIQMLSGLYMGNKETEKAVALYRPLVAKDKANHARIAGLYAQADANDKAVLELKAWTKDDPNNVAAWIALAEQYQNQPSKDEAAAKAAYDTAKKIAPKSVEPYRSLAQYLQRQNKLDDALKELAAAPKSGTGVEMIYQLSGSILETQKKFDEAAEQYRLAAKANPQAAASYSQSVARVLMAAGKTDEAIAEYRAAAVKSPKESTIQSGLAKALEAKGDKAGAITAWRKFGELNRYDTAWIGNVARLQDESGQSADAVKTLLDAYAKRPGDSEINKQLLPIAERAHMLDDVIAAYNKAAEKGPTNPSLYTQLGDVYTHKDLVLSPDSVASPSAVASGSEVFREYLRRFPKNEGIAHAFVSYATARGHWDDVVTANRALLAIRPNDVAVRAAVGDALVNANDDKGAEKEYKEILTKEASNKAAHLGLGRLYERQKRYFEARAEFEAVQRVEPSNTEATKALARMKGPVGASPEQPATPAPTPQPTPSGLTSPVIGR